MPRKNNIKIRRGNSQEWSSVNPILDSGELGYDHTNKTLKIGNASNTWSGLSSVVLGENPDLGPSSIQSNVICIRSPLIDFKTVSDINICTIPDNCIFLIEKMEVITTDINSAGSSPIVRFGNSNSYSAYYEPTAIESNTNGSRHIIENQPNAVLENSILTFGVTSASTASYHYGYALYIGFLVKTDSSPYQNLFNSKYNSISWS
jgi:hypothetical protein